MLIENGPPGKVQRWCIELGFSVPEKENIYVCIGIYIHVYVEIYYRN